MDLNEVKRTVHVVATIFIEISDILRIISDGLKRAADLLVDVAGPLDDVPR